MSSLYSPRWHRVATLTPRLSSHLRVQRQWLRGERWVVLSDPVGARSVRLNAAAYAVAGRLDGQRSVQQLWDWQLNRHDDPATQDEVIDLLAQLREAGLLQADGTADFDVLLPHLERVARPNSRGTLLAWRLPLGNPERWLERLAPLQPVLFSRAAGLFWALAAMMLLLLALQHAPTLWEHGQRWLATPRFAWLAALLYVPIKLLHELAHALAVRHWGGAVREAGVTLMLGLPVPYVDASAASAFERQGPRIVVGAAGMMAELAIAAIALPLWLWLGDGLWRDAAFATLVIAGASTLLFNANPLQRLDGYYILTDVFELPNLAPRSRQWWLQWLQRKLLRLPGAEPMPLARGEAPWLVAYAPLSWCCALLVASLAVAWLGQISLPLGLVCAALLAWQMLLRPMVTLLGQLRRSALAHEGTLRRWRRLATAGALASMLCLTLPLPRHTLVQGVVWPTDLAQLRANEDGFVETVAVREGQWVEAGELVLQLTNPSLATQLERQRARVQALETELFNLLPADSRIAGDPRTGDARAELAAAQQAAERLQERHDALAVHAGTAGRVALPQSSDLPGSFVRRGRLLGQVLADGATTVRVALPESQASELRDAAQSLSVRLAAAPQQAHPATLLRDSIGAVMHLPSAALSTRHGGDVVTDPKDGTDLKPLQPVVLLDVRLDDATPAARERVGERAWVRFDAGMAPLGWQALQALRREALQRFNPQF